MYNVNIDELHDIQINDQLFICETYSPSEAFRRRELNRISILNGTQITTKGQYVPIDVSFTTHIAIDPNRPDMYDHVFEEMMSKPAEILSPELGGKFNAQVLIKKEHDKYSMLKLTVQVIEIPGAESLIPGENKFVIPEDKLESEADKKAREAKNKTDEEKATTYTETEISKITNSKAFHEKLMATAKAWNKETKSKKKIGGT